MLLFQAGILGLLVGSFLNVVIVRLPLNLSVVRPRSFCPHCDKMISWYDNIPVISFCFLRGRCRACHEKISIRYPVVELLTMVLSLATYQHFQSAVPYLLYFLLFIAPMTAVIFIDLEHLIIPDAISLPGIISGLAVSLILSPLTAWKSVLFDRGLGILVGGGFLFLVGWGYEKLKKREGLGGGDVKLTAMFGAFFGWQAVIFILLMASVVGTVVGVFFILLKKKNWQYALPFGPFLVIAAFLYLFWGQNLLYWYLNLFKTI